MRLWMPADDTSRGDSSSRCPHPSAAGAARRLRLLLPPVGGGRRSTTTSIPSAARRPGSSKELPVSLCNTAPLRTVPSTSCCCPCCCALPLRQCCQLTYKLAPAPPAPHTTPASATSGRAAQGQSRPRACAAHAGNRAAHASAANAGS
jgi:hypothetical protein